MGYFDGLTAASFKRDSRGRDLYFFWGKLGKGRVIPSEADGAAVRRYLKNYFICLFVVVVPVVVLGNNIAFQPAWFILIGGMMLALLLGLLPLYVKVKDWEIADERITFAEAYTASAKAHGRGTMLALTILSVLLVACSLFVLLGTEAKLIGALGTLLFGASLLASLYMLRASRRG
jgi:hypothetical protein